MSNTKRNRAVLRPVYAWTWKIRDVNDKRWLLCLFAAPTRKRLIDDGKPTPEAQPVRVLMTPRPMKIGGGA